ncbi:DUF2262 domain-containing protein [Flammeovirgaceae bacterium SG7u.111]|nr:DUF2262 domain-containing protein [Flammeovirgaceae bacterium SG7u.132]WPO33167.1 DUF2262 domain-containing protein [Flammeovirgaceae bacterium SG7u.111]
MINLFRKKNKDFEVFANEYRKEEKEILVLTNDQSGGAGKLNNSWDASQYFLAYFDLEKNKLKKGNGRINWLLTDKECNEHGTTYPYHFKSGTIYHLKVRELKDKTVPEGRLPSFYNRFMVVKVVKENVQNDELLEVLKEYRKPVKFTDEVLGEFELNKDYGMLDGSMDWLNENVSVSLEVDIDDKQTWNDTLNILKVLFNEQKQKDLEFKNFAGEKLTHLANDWLQDENKEITNDEFERRIKLSELVISYDGGDFTAYYNDDDMFNGHIITVYGNLKGGLESAQIEG